MSIREMIRRGLNAGFKKIPMFGPLQPLAHKNGLAAMISIAKYDDGKNWVHLSVSRATFLPNWKDLNFVRDTFLGIERKALMVLAPESEHVNIHSYCHHLWHCLNEDPLPDFTMGTGSI